MNDPNPTIITVTKTVTRTSTTRTAIRLSEEQAAAVLRKHFNLPGAQVEFECSGGYLVEVDITDIQCTEEALHDA